MPFGKETHEVVCIGQLIRSAYLACNPLALSCIGIGYFLISLLKQSHVPELKCGHVIQHAFKFDNNNETNEIRYEWFTGTLSKLSDGLK